MKILVSGGAGYVGSLLVPALLERGHEVTVIDWMIYGQTLKPHSRLIVLEGELRHISNVSADVVIHLACVSNDPSFNLDERLGQSVNVGATERLVNLSRKAGVQRFIYASSSSVYGIKPDGVAVTEDMILDPLPGYARCKSEAEHWVLKAKDINPVVIRPATLCGYSPRQRLDLVVNIFTMQAVCKGAITVHGGTQQRANLHVNDMVRAYLTVLAAPIESVRGQAFNVGAETLTVLDIAQRVQTICGGNILINEGTNDPRSYVVDSEKIARVLGFRPSHTIEGAILELRNALLDGRLPNPLTDSKYYNIQQMQLCHIS